MSQPLKSLARYERERGEERMSQTMEQETHWHWDFTAFDEADSVANTIRWPVAVTVIGYASEADASIAAQTILDRKHFRLRRVWECNTCKFQGKILDTFQQAVDAEAQEKQS